MGSGGCYRLYDCLFRSDILAPKEPELVSFWGKISSLSSASARLLRFSSLFLVTGYKGVSTCSKLYWGRAEFGCPIIEFMFLTSSTSMLWEWSPFAKTERFLAISFFLGEYLFLRCNDQNLIESSKWIVLVFPFLIFVSCGKFEVFLIAWKAFLLGPFELTMPDISNSAYGLIDFFIS